MLCSYLFMLSHTRYLVEQYNYTHYPNRTSRFYLDTIVPSKEYQRYIFLFMLSQQSKNYTQYPNDSKHNVVLP